MSTKAEREKQEARARLLQVLKPGDTVYTILRHVSGSGMQRVISLLALPADGTRPIELSYNAALATGSRYDGGRDGMVRRGCGMDMGFDAVYSLSVALFGDGYKCIGSRARCPSNAHQGGKYARGQTHKDGYALRHQWL